MALATSQPLDSPVCFVHNLGQPPLPPVSTEALITELAGLATAVAELDAIGGALPLPVQQALLGLLTTRVRHLQEHLPPTAAPTASLDLAGLLITLTAFSRAYRPGWVCGLAREHTPEHGSWFEDAASWYEQALSALNLLAGPVAERRAALGHLETVMVAWVVAGMPTLPGRLVAIRAALRRCLARGVNRSDPALVALVTPVAHQLTAREFRAVRRAVQARTQSRSQPPATVLQRSVCAACQEDGLAVLATLRRGTDCSVCRGSGDLRAIWALTRALQSRHMTHVVLVGGVPKKWVQLTQTLATAGIDLRIVDGKAPHRTEAAARNIAWADLIVLWKPTPVDHAVTKPYPQSTTPGLPVVTVVSRGTATLCRSIIAFLARR